jgi:hypothetical protein
MDLNINNDNAKTIGTIIICIIFIIGLLIIIDEIYNLTQFSYRYTYLYNYGIINEKVCKDDKLEYETARFRIYNEIDKYKLDKDVFNKTWINYLSYIAIFILSILFLLAFGYLFYNIFIENNDKCNIDDPNNQSYLKKIFECICGDCHKYIPNCLINYCILFILIVVYPLIYILKVGIKLDLTWESGYYMKVFHILFFIALVYYLVVILLEQETTRNKLDKALVYTAFIIIFYMNDYIYNKTFDDYNNITKVANLYNDNNNNQMFFDIYKQEKPIKPTPITPPPELNEFKEKTVSELAKISADDKNIYDKNKKTIDEYYKKLRNYENDMKKYKDKYNIYENNKMEFPDVVYILYTMFPKLIGADKEEIITFFVLLVIIIIFSYYLKINKNKFGDYVFYTAFIYILGVLSLLIITNAVFNYNTYINKYLIYEPIHNYKNSINNKNTIFNFLINKDDKLIDFYKKTSGESFDNTLKFDSSSSDFKESEFIDKIKISVISDYNKQPPIPDANQSQILDFQLRFYLTIYSNTFIDNTYTSKISDKDNYIKYNNYYSSAVNYFQPSTTEHMNNYKLLKKYIDKLMYSNELAIKNRIIELKTNFKYYVYNNIDIDISGGLGLQKDKKYKESEINQESDENKEYTVMYKGNLHLINKAFDTYEELLKECRKIFIELFNVFNISCDYTNFLNKHEKIKELNKKYLNDKETEIEPTIKNEFYKKMIYLILEKLDDTIKKYINIIKVYIRQVEFYSVSGNIKTDDRKNIINKIINNYNLYAKDEDKHTDGDLKELQVKLEKKFRISKYNTMDSMELKKMNISMNNVSWSFTILVIIFAIILLEPLII